MRYACLIRVIHIPWVLSVVQESTASLRILGLRAGALFIGVLFFCGCSSSNDDAERFTPASDLARRALEAILTERTTGESSPGLRAGLPGLHVIDTHQKPEEKLSEFQILGERPSDTGRMFVVELTFQGVEKPQKVHFIVVGIDPLLIFREEDLAMVAHWDHVMPEAKPSEKEDPVSKGTSDVD